MNDEPSQDLIEVRLRSAAQFAPVRVLEDHYERDEEGRRRLVSGSSVPIRIVMVEAAEELERLRAAVNALPELLAENERLKQQVRELSDCQRLPKVYKYTGTAGVDVENMFDVGHRHRNGKQPGDYLMSWLSMLRPFAYATKDDSWGELEKLISIVMNNYVQILVRAEKARAALKEIGQ
jgi:hypothetical protein